nr:MAG TPA: hypothetical protein [Caudoviricetes sp.]DAT52526.1 MAG TPA: hypothetical protein [Caudoviricetes sp.]
MYTILMRDDKSLITTVRQVIYQRDKLVDKIKFYIPTFYDGISLEDFTVRLKYIDQDELVHSIDLSSVKSDKDGFMKYVIDVDTDLTRHAGTIRIHLTLNKVDMEEGKEYSLNTGETSIIVTPLADYYGFVSDSSLSVIDQKMNELNVKLEAVNKMATTYDETKADNIKLDKESSEIYLTANDKQIGDKIAINDLGDTIADETKDGLIPIIL